MAPTLLRGTPGSQAEVSRLLTAAVINQNFRLLLLTDPIDAIERGFQGEPFRLEREEKERILAIRASSLADFARQLTSASDLLLVMPKYEHPGANPKKLAR